MPSISAVSGASYTYVGCFADSSDRDLPVNIGSSDANAPGYCSSKCAGYQYFGLQYSSECWCGDSYGSQGSSSGCTMACAGDDNIACGGRYG